MKESDLRSWFIDLMRGTGIKIQRIEMPHVPDLYIRTYETEGWIELKQVTLKPIIKIPWRPGQLPWIENHVRLGGKAWLFIGFEDSVAIFRDRAITRAYTQEQLLYYAYVTGKLSDFSQTNMLDILQRNYFTAHM